MAKKVTINKVAERAGVSRGTVDRVLNQRPHVKEDAYKKVVTAMKELNYMPANKEQAEAFGLKMPGAEVERIGIILPNWQGYFRKEILKGIERAKKFLEAQMVEVLVEECETEIPDEYVEKMETLLEKKVAGIAICAKDHPIIIEKVEQLFDEGIPVVTYNCDLSTEKRLCFIGQDLFRSGRVAGELMSKYLRREDHVLIAVGNSEFSGHRLRINGFRKRLEEDGFVRNHQEIIETYNDYTVTYQKVKEVLERNPKIRGIYMANHSVAGCVEAIQATERQGEIFVVSHDLTGETKRFLERKEIAFTIGQDIQRQSYKSLSTLWKYIFQNKKPVEEDFPMEVICAENLMGRD